MKQPELLIGHVLLRFLSIRSGLLLDYYGGESHVRL